MSYRTDMVEQILTSEEGKIIIEYLSPIYGKSYVGLWLLQVIGMQLDKASKWTAELALQVTPETATWTIEFWENEYGIIPNPAMTLEQRRAQVEAKMMGGTAVTGYRIEQTIKNMFNVDCEVLENTDSFNNFSANEFRVAIRKYVDDETIEKVRTIVDDMKPAHLIFDIFIAELFSASGVVNAGIGVSSKEKYKLRVVQ